MAVKTVLQPVRKWVLGANVDFEQEFDVTNWEGLSSISGWSPTAIQQRKMNMFWWNGRKQSQSRCTSPHQNARTAQMQTIATATTSSLLQESVFSSSHLCGNGALGEFTLLPLVSLMCSKLHQQRHTPRRTNLDPRWFVLARNLQVDDARQNCRPCRSKSGRQRCFSFL